MNMVWTLLTVIVGTWALALITLGIAEGMLRKRDRQMLEMRDFREKIDAMRRMAEREGNV